MNKLNKNILRSILLMSYLVIIGLVIYGSGSIYSYLNTGADRSTMLHTSVKQIAHYLPEFQWAHTTNIGRPINDETLSAIKIDYLEAWYSKCIAYRTNTTQSIADYYTKSAKENIINIVALNTKNKTTIETTTLKHDPYLEFFSEDGKFAVLTDRDVVEYKRIFKDQKLILETTEKSNYSVTLLLEDGFWRVRHLVRLAHEVLTKTKNVKPIKISEIKGINYYPQANPWDMFGEDFNAKVLASDFQLIASSGLNSIRIFVPYHSFGKSNVNTHKLSQLLTVLDLAHEAKLKVMVALFDFYGDYSVQDWTLTQKHANTIVNAIKHHKALFSWDIKNEPNLDFESRGETLVTAWLANMIDFVKSADPKHPVTIGWSHPEPSLILKDKLDFISFHYYENINMLDKTYKALKAKITDKPIVISEFGVSSYQGLWQPFGYSEADQAQYHKTIQSICHQNNIPFMSWTLYDFTEIPKEIFGGLPWQINKQKYFGFIDSQGNKKPSFKYISKE